MVCDDTRLQIPKNQLISPSSTHLQPKQNGVLESLIQWAVAEERTEPVGLAWLFGQWGSGQASSPNLRDSCCFRKFDPRGTKRQIAQILAQGNNTGSQWKNQGTRGRLNYRKKTAVVQCGAYSEGRTGDTVEQSPLAETQPQSPAWGSQSIKIGWLFN